MRREHRELLTPQGAKGMMYALGNAKLREALNMSHLTFDDLAFAELEFVVPCARKKHTIKTTKSGRIYFVDHGISDPRAMLAEGQLRLRDPEERNTKVGTTLRGCALVAYMILHERDAREFQYNGRGRTKKMREMHDVGIPDVFMTDFLLSAIRRKGMRSLSRKNTDPLRHPFVGPPPSISYGEAKMGPRIELLYRNKKDALLRTFSGAVERARLQRGISTK